MTRTGVPGIFALVMLACGCSSVALVSEGTEERNALKQHSAIVSAVGAYDDERLAGYVQEIGARIAASSDRPGLSWRFTVLNTSDPRAFATSGGYVYVTRGLLAYLRSEDELAGVLAHEIAHVCARDSVHKQVTSEAVAWGLLIGAPHLLLFPSLANLFVSPVAAGAAAVSRHDEMKADRNGSEYLARAGLRPSGVSDALESLKTIERYQRDQHGATEARPWHRLFATHPDTETRESRLRDTVPDAKTRGLGERFRAVLEGVQAVDRYDGFTHRGKTYFGEDLFIAVDVPEGWVVRAGKAGIRVARKDGKAWFDVRRTSSRPPETPPCAALLNMHPGARDAAPLHDDERRSCWGVVEMPAGFFRRHNVTMRVGIVAGGGQFVFQGRTAEAQDFPVIDPVFREIAASLEPLSWTSDVSPDPPRVRFRRAAQSDSFASLAAGSRLPGDAESYLRAINHRYPDGQLEPGEWIKVVE